MKIDMKGFVTKTYIDTPFGRKGPISANVTFALTVPLGSYDDLEATMNHLITAGELNISITEAVDWAEKYNGLIKELEKTMNDNMQKNKDMAECTCMDNLKCPDVGLWVCPKHGYKKR